MLDNTKFQNPAINCTIDAFHQGRLFLAQPEKQGHRSGIDAMLLAALVPEHAKGSLADLGAGAGAVGLAVASRCKELNVTLIEHDSLMCSFAEKSVALPQNSAFSHKCRILNADVELSGQARMAAGLHDNDFDHVTMNPPFNEIADRQTPDSLKAKAHVMSGPDLLEKWIKTACAIAKPNGQLSLIARPSSLANILEACQGRFGGLEITQVQPFDQTNAIRILVTGIKGSKARLVMRSPIILHLPQKKGEPRQFTKEAHKLINGLTIWKRGNTDT